MAGRTPPEAVRAFTEPIQEALTCFAHGRVAADSYDPDTEGILHFNKAEDVRLSGEGRVQLSITMRYRIVKIPNPIVAGKSWKVSTTGWVHSLKDRAGQKIVDFHWHPAVTPDIPFPHLHAPTDPLNLHLPTGRVLVEDVLMLAVECGAEPIDEDKWRFVHARNLANFAKGATWGVSQQLTHGDPDPD